jgi:hypothetical protein
MRERDLGGASAPIRGVLLTSTVVAASGIILVYPLAAFARQTVEAVLAAVNKQLMPG